MSKLEQVVESVSSVLGAEYSVCSVEVLKNNGMKTDGILVQGNGERIGATIYVTKEYLENATVSEIADFVCREYWVALASKNSLGCMKDFADGQFVLSNVVYQLINKQRNADFLSSVPHKDFLDLALIYRVVLAVSDEGISSYVVSTNFLSKISISIEELDGAAKENTIHRLGIRYSSLKELLGINLPHKEAISQFYVLTNEVSINGATLMTYSSVLSEIAGKLGSNLIILPSSIHEVLLLAEDVDLSIADLGSMVQEVNKSEVLVEDFLSNSVYRFVKDTGVVELA